MYLVIRKLLSLKISICFSASMDFYSNHGTRDKQSCMHESMVSFSMATIINSEN